LRSGKGDITGIKCGQRVTGRQFQHQAVSTLPCVLERQPSQLCHQQKRFARGAGHAARPPETGCGFRTRTVPGRDRPWTVSPTSVDLRRHVVRRAETRRQQWRHRERKTAVAPAFIPPFADFVLRGDGTAGALGLDFGDQRIDVVVAADAGEAGNGCITASATLTVTVMTDAPGFVSLVEQRVDCTFYRRSARSCGRLRKLVKA
jgi:hypothetical protein